MKNISLLLNLIILSILSCQKGIPDEEIQDRYVEGQTLISKNLPEIKISIDRSFVYVGKFDFKIRNVAAGERFVFVESEDNKIKRMFIAQFEGFLPSIDDFYRYNMENASQLGNHKFRQNTYAYSNLKSIAENPEGEAALTFNFLKDKGFTLEDEWMMSRFVTVTGVDKKHELILFYLENVSDSGHQLIEFYDAEDNNTEIWKHISKSLTERSLQHFKVIE